MTALARYHACLWLRHVLLAAAVLGAGLSAVVSYVSPGLLEGIDLPSSGPRLSGAAGPLLPNAGATRSPRAAPRL